MAETQFMSENIYIALLALYLTAALQSTPSPPITSSWEFRWDSKASEASMEVNINDEKHRS